MESSVEKLEGLASKLTVEVPAEKIDQAVEKRLKELRPRIRIDGFRPGKVPPHIIKQRYSASARQDVLSQEIDAAYREALKNTDLEPIAAPEINLISGFKEGEVLKFDATIEVAPEVDVKGMDDLAVTLPKTELKDSDVDDMVETLRKQQATFTETDKPTAENDRITIDFIGKLDGEEFEGGKGEDVAVQIGAGQMLPDFEEGLKGMKAGDEKTFDVAFPKNYQAENLAGKTAQFTATAKKVKEMHLPEVDDAFIKRFGLEAADLESFKAAIRKNMERELENADRRIRRERLFDAILEKNGDQVVPNASLHQEMERMAKEMKLDEQIPDADKRHQLMHQIFEPQAKRRLQLGFLLGKLFEEHKVELDQDRVNERLNTIASTYEDPAEVKKWYQNDAQARVSLESAILEEQLIDKLYETAKVTEEPKTFQEIMAINSQIRN